MIESKIIDKICFLEMQNPEHLNCLSHKLCTTMMQALCDAYDNECVCVIIKAQCRNGVWSAGHDIRELPTNGNDPLAFDAPMLKLLHMIQDIPIPIVAYVEGSVWGGACDLCLSCDMIIAVDTATFAITPAKIGIPYNSSGLMHFINQLGINKAREMFFTSNKISAQDALNVGFLNHIAPAEELPLLLEEKILKPLRQNSIMSISAMKRQFRILSRAASSIAAENFERINAFRERVYRSNDYLEGINSFIEKRSPKYNGKAKDLDIYNG
ncbi:MAG: methylmalonyl-CoA decarboxylase [Bacteroidales bacterium]